MTSDVQVLGETMQAVVQHGYGSADVLRLEHVARPMIAENEVLLRVHAAGLDRGTWHLMTGQPYLLRLALGLRTLKHPVAGRDLAGTVLAIGPAVTRFAVGDEVYGTAAPNGSFAEFAAAREDKLARKPANLSFTQAAVVPVSGITALHALTDVGHIEAGQRVLVIGASGGVGTFAVQLATAYGADVTGVCSPSKIALVRSLGARRVLDYTRDDFADGTCRYDLILDIAGNPSPTRLLRALTPTGTAVIVGGEGRGTLTGGLDRQLRALVLSLFVRPRLTGFVATVRASDLDRLTDLIEAGRLKPSVDRTYPLAGVPEAIRQLVAGNVHGKIAITT